MAATTKQSISRLIDELRTRLPQVTLTESSDFSWLPDTGTILYDPNDPNAVELLLHEASHADLGHQQYRKDIELITIEQEAWHHAHSIATDLNLTIRDDTIQDSLDTYREWLHARSTCPRCKANGVQDEQLNYLCPSCETKWHVNPAIGCQLRRYQIN